ncbi:MAG: hypothetical protein ACHQ1H_05415 [Nitrososphaerales archaeon]
MTEITFKKDALLAAPKDEQHFFILAGHFLNELATLARLVAWTAGYSSDNRVLATGGAANKVAVLNYTISKLFEGWKLVEKRFTSELRQKYLPKFNPTNADSYAILVAYFVNKDRSRIEKVRNNLGFHNYDQFEMIYEAFCKVESPQFSVYMNEAPGLCLFDPSIQTMGFCLGKIVNEEQGNFDSSFKELMKEIREIAEHMQFLLFDYQCCFIAEYLDGNCEKTKLVLDHLPDQDSVQIPYFTNSWK